MGTFAVVLGALAAFAWLTLDRQALRVWRGIEMSAAMSAAADWTAAGMVGFAVHSAVTGDWRLSVFLLVSLLVLVVSLRLVEREGPRDPPIPPAGMERPSYMPPWWSSANASSRYIASSPGRALGWYVPWMILSVAILAYRVVGGDSMSEEFGEPWDVVLPIVAVVSLGFTWVYALRAVEALRAERERR